MESAVLWMMTLRPGMLAHMLCLESDEPTAKTRSASLRKWNAAPFIAASALPSASAWRSGNALLPASVE